MYAEHAKKKGDFLTAEVASVLVGLRRDKEDAEEFLMDECREIPNPRSRGTALLKRRNARY